MDKEVLILKYIDLINQAISIDILSDLKATKYNKIIKKIWKIQKLILERIDYYEIYIEILRKTDNDKYRQIHYDMAESLYLIDKKFMLEIYKIHKWRAIADARIKEIEDELKIEDNSSF